MNWRVRARTSVGALALDVDLGGNVEPVALVGPNGSGKTTLLRVITGALRPESGTITVGERVLFSSNDSVDVPIEDRRVGYVPQGHRLFPHLGVEDNVAFGLTGTRPRPSRSECRARALDMLAKLGCSNLAARSPHRLSGGERQRVALARALVIEPQILLLDEPLSAMDASARRRLRTFLGHHLAALARPALVVTHDVRDVTAIGATVVVLESGRVVQRGTVDDLRAAPATDFVAEFVGA